MNFGIELAVSRDSILRVARASVGRASKALQWLHICINICFLYNLACQYQQNLIAHWKEIEGQNREIQ